MSVPVEMAALRILDASTNRATEGLRTMEEFARFVLEDRHLSGIAKQLRHDLRAVLGAVVANDRLIARSVASDCGTTLEATDELRRDDVSAVARAAASRVQEAVRCIEEYGKTIEGFDSRKVEAIRYRVYTLAAALSLMHSRVERLCEAKLYLLVATDVDRERFANHITAMFTSGVDIIQLRDKRADDRCLYECSRMAADIARRLGKIFIVNDRADIAVATYASGVHVGQDELPVEAVRRIVGAQGIVGVSTHDLDQAKAAVLDGADYIGCGPTFPSQTKSFDQFPGLAFLRQVAGEISLPTYAIGGIDQSNFSEVMATGIHGVAITSAILNASDPLEASQWFHISLRNQISCAGAASSTTAFK
jgi:thiamine-phosphate pyrophosphorylase